MNQKAVNRGFILIAASIIGLMTGTVHIWSVFRNPLMHARGWTASEVTLAYSLFMLAVLIGCFLSGSVQSRFKPSVIVFFGGIIQGVGFILTGFADSLFELYFYYSIMAGLGNGFISNTAVSVATRWFPDKAGQANGLCIGCMGVSPLIFAPIGNTLIEHFDVFTSFKLNGSMMILLFGIFAWFLIMPPDDWSPSCWNTTADEQVRRIIASKDYSTGDMLKTPLFLILWASIICTLCAGVMVTAQASDIAQHMASLSSSQAATVVGILAVNSFIGRIGIGTLSDKLGRFNAVLIALAFSTIILLFFFPKSHTFVSFLICLFFIGVCFGGTMACLPGFVTDNFGGMNFGLKYPCLYSAYTVASFIGPLLASVCFDRNGNYKSALIIAGVISLIGIAGMFISRNMSNKMRSSVAKEK